jgi:type VI secretion system protein ImpH
MAPPSRRTSVAVSRQLADEPYRFEFFQAVRLLEQLASQADADASQVVYLSVGYDHSPQHEAVRFKALVSHTFPSSEIVSLKMAQPSGSDERSGPMSEMVVPFLGLIGPSGVLPRHYTQLVMDRIRQKDFALRDFLDLFHHRTISFFFRAWEKYRMPVAMERVPLEPAATKSDLWDRDAASRNLFTSSLYALVGLGTQGLRNRLTFRDQVLLYFGGHFSHRPKTVTALENMLQEYFELPLSVLQFQGQWLTLAPEDRSQTSSPRFPRGQNCQLGRSITVGRRVWSIENKFRIRLGPLTYGQFRRFLPGQPGLVSLCQLVRTYVGAEYDFDVQPVLKAAEVPACQLGGQPPDLSRLGWNTWLRSQPMPHDADDPVFEHSGGGALCLAFAGAFQRPLESSVAGA